MPANVLAGSGYVSIGATPATFGAIRLANASAIYARDVGNTSNVELLALTAGDVIELGATTGHDIVIGSGLNQELTLDCDSVGLMGGIQVGSTTMNVGGATEGAIGITDSTGPSTDPTAGVVLYSHNGVAKVRQANGAVAIVGGGYQASVAIAALDIDWTLGDMFTKTLAAGANTFTFSGTSDGKVILVRVTGAASTLTWPTVIWSGGVAPTQTASGTDIYTLFFDGANIYGAVDSGGGAAFTAPTGTGLMTTTAGAMDAASAAVGAGVLTFLATPSGANLASALTTALPDSKGGTGLTALGSGVATMLGTFSSANIKAACSDETGSGGGLVFATSPTLTNPTINGQLQGATVGLGALDIDWTLGAVFSKTLAAGANTFTFSGQTSGMVIVVRLTGAASTVTWPTVKWPGGVAPTQTASGIDVYTFVYDGTSVYGSVVQAMA